MKKIDLENHFYDESVIQALAKRDAPPRIDKERTVIHWTDQVAMPQEKILPQLLEIAEQRKELLESQGITTAVLSSSPGPEQFEKETSIEVCHKTNRSLYEITKRLSPLYLGSAILPVNSIPDAIKELETCVKEYGFVSWHTHSNYGDSAPDEERYRPLFQKAADLGVYIYLHPQLPSVGRAGDYGFTVAGPGLGFTLDTITTITKMIVSGLFDEIPNLKVVLGHLGEAIPFLLDRMDNRLTFLPNPRIKAKHNMSYYFKHNILVTTSGNMSAEAFACAKNVLGIENICFGSDYPYEKVGDMMNFLNEIPLSQKERELLFYQNALEKLGIRP